MNFTIEISNNKEFKHDDALEEDFDFNVDIDNELKEYFPIYNKYKQNLCAEVDECCRESLMSILGDFTDCKDTVYCRIIPSDFNQKLLSFVINNCEIAEKIFLDVSVGSDRFGFTLNTKDMDGYLHFISFLILLCDYEFSGIKTRTKSSGIWGNKTRKEVADSLIKIIEKLTDDAEDCVLEEFTIHDVESIKEYIDTIVSKNKVLKNTFCDGPETAINNT
jgi:hypothetical protein